MIEYGTKTISQKIKVNDVEYNIIIKVLHNFEAAHITMSVNSDKDFFNIELTQVDMTEAHVVLNEVMNIFRSATGLPMNTVGPFPAPAVMPPPSMAPCINTTLNQ